MNIKVFLESLHYAKCQPDNLITSFPHLNILASHRRYLILLMYFFLHV